MSKFNFSKRRVFFISDSQLTAYFWDRNKFGQSYFFDASVEGLGFFQDYLTTVKEDTVYVLLDVKGEKYHLDTIPHVFGKDRQAVIKRKQERVFKGAKYFFTDIQERQKTGRRDYNIMLSAITETSAVQTWLDRMLAQNISIASIVSLPFLIQDTKDIVPDIQDNNLIFSLQSTSGLRQSFFVGNVLKFSRLVTMPRFDGVDHYATIITDELTKIQQYIRSTSLIEHRNTPLDIYLLANHALLQAMQAKHINTSMARYHFLDCAVLARQSGLVGTMDAKHPFSDQYFVYQLLKHKNKNYYATKEEKQYLFMRDMKKLLLLGSAGMLLCSLIVGGLNIFDGMDHKYRQIDIRERADLYNKQYDLAQKKMPELPFAVDNLKVAVDLHQQLQQYQADPRLLFAMLSKSLDDFPEIKIQKIRWAANVDKDYNFSADSSLDQSTFAINADGDEQTFLYYYIVIFSGYLPGFDGDYRKGLGHINRFVEALKKSKDTYAVNIIKLPVDVDSDVRMQGSTGQRIEQSDFSLRVVFGVQDEA